LDYIPVEKLENNAIKALDLNELNYEDEVFIKISEIIEKFDLYIYQKKMKNIFCFKD